MHRKRNNMYRGKNTNNSNTEGKKEHSEKEAQVEGTKESNRDSKEVL